METTGEPEEPPPAWPGDAERDAFLTSFVSPSDIEDFENFFDFDEGLSPEGARRAAAFDAEDRLRLAGATSCTEGTSGCEAREALPDAQLALAFLVLPSEAFSTGATASPAALIDRVVYFEKVIAWAQAGKATAVDDAVTRALANAETGKATGHDRWEAPYAAERAVTAEIACALRIPEGTACALIRDSRSLTHALPATLAALRAGQISERHVHRLIDHVSSLPALSQPEFEEALLPLAKTLTVAKFDLKARRLREALHPDTIAERRLTCLANRRVALFPGQDSMSTLWISAASDDLQAIFTRLTDTATSLQGTDELRNRAQLTADVAVDLLLTGVTETGLGAGISAHVNVTVPVLTLLGRSEEPGSLEGYGPIDPETARRLAGTATSFTRILTHPETGIVLSVSNEHFAVPAALKRYQQIRDETCRFPGCNRTARHSDLDHTIARQFGGPTTSTNLAHLCKPCHALKHNTNWTVTQTPNGNLHWTSPAGKHYAMCFVNLNPAI
ncbi:HNH endonuclease signature motif containing protein [Cryobacterium sp. CG_9.6]|uniref:HNH endonuclease signature motif containing protein n=1 Tax=Cryobacterium sp. CG_9.6 TaxID=2760710 RepID=UPI0024770727|nr:HNH endonuclease signature motif containing protein [Cryobacterium sp. CG_9.6]MDH6236421.1 hypothetical protein [Cryobacterium sp. CG_9.6]